VERSFSLRRTKAFSSSMGILSPESIRAFNSSATSFWLSLNPACGKGGDSAGIFTAFLDGEKVAELGATDAGEGEGFEGVFGGEGDDLAEGVSKREKLHRDHFPWVVGRRGEEVALDSEKGEGGHFESLCKGKGKAGEEAGFRGVYCWVVWGSWRMLKRSAAASIARIAS
jgi:hypothetical protein